MTLKTLKWSVKREAIKTIGTSGMKEKKALTTGPSGL